MIPTQGVFASAGIPGFLRMNFRVTDGAGKTIAAGKDLAVVADATGREGAGNLRGVAA